MLRNTGVTSLTPQRGNQAMSVNVDGTRRVAENCDDEPRFLMALVYNITHSLQRGCQLMSERLYTRCCFRLAVVAAVSFLRLGVIAEFGSTISTKCQTVFANICRTLVPTCTCLVFDQDSSPNESRFFAGSAFKRHTLCSSR